jgi:hypothetical protein
VTNGNYEFTFRGQPISASVYGDNYVPEFLRILETYGGANTKHILEWGSGVTSLVILEYAKRWQSNLFLTIDGDAEYQDAVFAGRAVGTFVQKKALHEIGPGRGQSDPELTYSSYPLYVRPSFDLIFIDGRRRVECAYNAALLCHSESTVILHDYRRGRYQSVFGLFEAIEEGPQFLVLRIREGIYKELSAGRERTRGFMAALKLTGVDVEWPAAQ